MRTWYDCKLSYEATNDNGKQSKITENYLVDAVNLTEAEAILTKEVSSYINGEFKIEVVKMEKIYDLFQTGDCDHPYFKAKVSFVVIDEEKGKEKRVNCNIYTQSPDIDSSIPNLKENLKGTMCDYEILSVVKTKIIDVIKNVSE